MNIQYLNKLRENIKIGTETSEGVSESDIKKVEEKFNIVFPKAYKEYLFLVGEYSGSLPIQDTDDLATISADWHQEIMWAEIERSGIKFERPFWLFAESNACEQFWFFYLDENTEDPNVYAFEYGTNTGDRKIIPLNMTFSQLINRQIDMAIEEEKYH